METQNEAMSVFLFSMMDTEGKHVGFGCIGLHAVIHLLLKPNSVLVTCPPSQNGSYEQSNQASYIMQGNLPDVCGYLCLFLLTRLYANGMQIPLPGYDFLFF